MNKELQEKRYGSRQVTLAALCLQLNTCRRQGFTDHVNPKDPNPSLSNGKRNSKLSQYDVDHLNFGIGLMKTPSTTVLKNLPKFDGALRQLFGGIENPTDKRMIGRETNGTTIFNSFQDASDFYDAFDTKNK